MPPHRHHTKAPSPLHLVHWVWSALFYHPIPYSESPTNPLTTSHLPTHHHNPPHLLHLNHKTLPPPPLPTLNPTHHHLLSPFHQRRASTASPAPPFNAPPAGGASFLHTHGMMDQYSLFGGPAAPSSTMTVDWDDGLMLQALQRYLGD